MKFRYMFLIAVGLTVLLILFASLSGILLGLAAAVISLVTGATGDFDWLLLILLIFAWSFLPDRFKVWPRAYEIRGETVINARAEDIWDLVLPQVGKTPYRHLYDRVTAVPGHPDQVKMHPETGAASAATPVLQVQLHRVEPPSYLQLRYTNLDDFPLFAKDLVKTEYFLEQEGDQVRVTLIETLDKLRVSSVLSLLLLNPCRDSLKRLKAVSEGTDDPSWMTWMGRDTEQENGVMARTTVGVGLMVCVLLTGVVFGIVGLVLSIAPL